MQAFLIYILKLNVVVTALYAVYVLLLRKLTFYHANRYYLLATLLTSAVLPFFQLPVFLLEDTPVVIHRFAGNIAENGLAQVTTSVYDKTDGVHGVAILVFCGIVFFIVKFILRILSVHSVLRRSVLYEKKAGYSISASLAAARLSDVDLTLKWLKILSRAPGSKQLITANREFDFLKQDDTFKQLVQ